MKTCALIAGGDRLNQPTDAALYQKLALLYYDYGIRKILCGVRPGTELITLNTLLKVKEEYPNLKIDGVFTHEEEANHWREEEREMLYRVIALCDEELILKPVYGNEMLFQRNILMMNISDIVVVLGEDQETEYWANKMMKPLLKLVENGAKMLPELKLYRREAPQRIAINNTERPRH